MWKFCYNIHSKSSLDSIICAGTVLQWLRERFSFRQLNVEISETTEKCKSLCQTFFFHSKFSKRSFLLHFVITQTNTVVSCLFFNLVNNSKVFMILNEFLKFTFPSTLLSINIAVGSSLKLIWNRFLSCSSGKSKSHRNCKQFLQMPQNFCWRWATTELVGCDIILNYCVTSINIH